MLTPLDDFVDSVPPQMRTLEVYVSDATLQVTGKKSTLAGSKVNAAKWLFAAFQE